VVKMSCLAFVLCLTVFGANSSYVIAQEPGNPATSPPTAAKLYPNTTAGFHEFLTDCITAAKATDQSELGSLIASTAIPNYEQWFRKTYPGPAESWIGPYGKELRDKQILMKNLLSYLAHQNGELVIKKVIDSPDEGKGMEWGMLHAAAQPVDIYFASWNAESALSEQAYNLPIGHFYFIDGAFRLDSLIRYSNAPIYRVDPIYPYPSDGNHPVGLVLLGFKILEDGSVSRTNIKASSNQSHGFSSDPKLIKAAADALMQWRFRPPNLYVLGDEMALTEIIKVAPLTAAGVTSQDNTKKTKKKIVLIPAP
jgi:hypothetical protein